MSINSISKKYFYKLRSEWRELNEEKRQLESLLEMAWQSFYPTFLRKIESKNIDDPFSKEIKKEDEKNNSFFNEDEIKSKYRDAAKLTHPDRKGVNNLDSFKNISKAKKEGSLNKFYDEVRSSKIDLGEISFIEIDKLEKEIKDLKKELNQMNDCFYLKWFYSGPERREEILNSIINNIKNV